MTDKTLGACQCHEKHAPTYWKGIVREYKDALEKAESRPLTPDAITDEAMRRAVKAWEETGELRPAIFAAITAPARPEGAEEIERLIRDLLGSHPGDWYGDLADHLAAHLTDPTRKEG